MHLRGDRCPNPGLPDSPLRQVRKRRTAPILPSPSHRSTQPRGAGPTLNELQNVLLRVKLTDKVTGSPLPGALPAAWIDSHHGAGPISQPQCVGEVKRFAEGSTFSHTQLDLTSFYVVLMNTDATLTVVDPRFGYGDTRLLAMVALDGPAEDWAVTEKRGTHLCLGARRWETARRRHGFVEGCCLGERDTESVARCVAAR